MERTYNAKTAKKSNVKRTYNKVSKKPVLKEGKVDTKEEKSKVKRKEK